MSGGGFVEEETTGLGLGGRLTVCQGSRGGGSGPDSVGRRRGMESRAHSGHYETFSEVGARGLWKVKVGVQWS